MIRYGEWKNHGNTWNKRILYVFGDVNLISNKYRGKKELENANKILKFKNCLFDAHSRDIREITRD